MPAAQYKIDTFEFEFWRGPSPTVRVEHGKSFNKPGVDGVGLQSIGFYGDPFGVTLTSWWPPDGNAYIVNELYANLVHSTPKLLVYNGVDYDAIYSLRYYVLEFAPVRIQRKPTLRRAGAIDGVLYQPGDEHTSRWTLLPQVVTT